jgi:hypothetical protein
VMRFSNAAGELTGNLSADCASVSWPAGAWLRAPAPRIFPTCGDGPALVGDASAAHAGCPLAPSPGGASVAFTGRHCNHDTSLANADTFYPSDLPGGGFFTSFMDGHVSGVGSSGGEGVPGFAVIGGSTPDTWTLRYAGNFSAPNAPLRGRYATAAFAQDDALYYGTYGLDNGVNVPQFGSDVCNDQRHPHGGDGYCLLGPFAGFHVSTDGGGSWSDAGFNFSHNVFGQVWPEPPRPWQFKIAQPHFVDFGPNNPSPDGRAYMVTHGCDPETAGLNCSWTSGSGMYMLRSRARLTPASANDASAWEFWSAPGQWADDVQAAAPVFSWPSRVGTPYVTWSAHLGRFLLFSRSPGVMTPDGLGEGLTKDLYVAESVSLEGPWRLVAFLPQFGPEGDWPVVKSSWLQPLNATAVSAWLLYSQYWSRIEGREPSPPYCTAPPVNNATENGDCYGLVAAQIVINVPAAAAAPCRDRFLWPFAVDNPFNVPIGSGAEFTPARIFDLPPGPATCALRLGAAMSLRTICAGWNSTWTPDTCVASGCCYDPHPSPDPGGVPWCFRRPGQPPQWGIHNDRDIVARASGADPLTDWISQGDWGPDKKCAVTGKVVTQIPLPLNLSIGCDGGNNAMGLLLPDNVTLVQMQPAYRSPTAGAPLLAQYAKGCPVSFPLNISVLSADPRGAHGGSGLSSVGGTVRAGELLPGAVIRHALKLELFAHDYYFSGGSDAPYEDCFAWPATGCDGYAHDAASPLVYNGTQRGLQPGALLAVPAAAASRVNVSTEPGRILLAALAGYGAYLVDDKASDSAAVCMELAAQQELRDVLEGEAEALARARRGGPYGDNTTAFFADLMALFQALSVVTNNRNSSVGGGGAPLSPLAPPICGA